MKKNQVRFLGVALLISTSVWGQSNTSTIEFGQGTLERLKPYVGADLFYTHDYISNTGGIKQGPRNIGALDIYIESDLSNYSGIQGQFQFHYLHINQNDTRGNIGDAQFASNIDVPSQVDRIADLWYQHSWGENFHTLIGLHDISMEFNVTESSLSFLNSSFGTAADLTYSGSNGPSIYPITALGTRLLYQFNESISLRSGVYDADPGGVETYRSFHSDVGSHEGFLHISELVYQDDERKIGLGGWNHTNRQDNINGAGRSTLFGLYSMAEQKLSHSLYSFIRISWSNPLVNEIQTNFVTGMAYKGIFQKKKVNDEVGLGMTRVHFSRPFLKETAAEAESDFESNETAYEAYYQFKPLNILSLRPDIQYISNPSGLTNLKDAWAVGMRTVVEI